MARKGLGLGTGSGYKNMIPKDPNVHSQSAKGIKQPQKMPVIPLKNEMFKERKVDNPYEIWKSADGQWEWRVLKKWQIDDNKPYARWFCAVKSPFTYGSFDYGDVYVKEIKENATKDQIVGGLGDNKPDSDFDKAQLEKGMKVESEHSPDKEIQKEISKDHLTEDKNYYKKLEKMEKKSSNVKRRKHNFPDEEETHTGFIYNLDL